MADKLLALRIFEDSDGRMNVNVGDAGGELLCVSNFTVYGDVQRKPAQFHRTLRLRNEAEPSTSGSATARAQGGVFGAHMAVSS